MYTQKINHVSFFRFFTFTMILIFTQSIYGNAPVLYFSDITDAPITGWEQSDTKGAAISIYVRNAGLSRGTSYVSVGGVDLINDDDYAEWGATTNPIVPLGIQRISFYLNSNMSINGSYPNTTISLTTSEGTSQTIPFHTRALGTNHIYYVDITNGSDYNDGFTLTTAKRSPHWVREYAEAGDIFYFKSGLYNEEDDGTDTHGWADNGIFSFCYGSPKNFHDGIEGKSISVTAFPGDLVRFEAIDNDGGDGHPDNFIHFIYTQVAYWTFSKFEINALQPVNPSDNVSPPYDGKFEHMRFINLDITTPWIDNSDWNNYSYVDGFDFYSGDHSSNIYILGSYIHDIAVDYRGQPQSDPIDGFRSYMIYFNGYGIADHIEVAWNEFGWNSSSRGLQFYGHRDGDRIDSLFIHDNWIHDTNRQGLIFSGEGGDVDYSFVVNAFIYNNIIEKSGTNDVVLQMGGSYGNGKYGGNYYVYNNIFDGANNDEYPTIHVGYDLDYLYLKNNIILGQPNAYNYYTYFPSFDPIPSDHVTADHNLYFGAGASTIPDWDVSDLTNDNPLFVNEIKLFYDDFRVEQNSPVRDAGDNTINLTSKDFYGTERGDYYDIGVFDWETMAMSVNLLGFSLTLEKKSQGIRLLWSTASEMDNTGFEIQKINNDGTWEKIGWLAGVGHSSALQNYSFLDTKPHDGINIYRLKQIDYDGSINYSDVNNIIYKEEKHILKLYPNPTKGHINIYSPFEEYCAYKLYDNIGKLVHSGIINHDSLIQLPTLPKGLYILSLWNGNKFVKKSIVVD